jgi:hypothetical protein
MNFPSILFGVVFLFCAQAAAGDDSFQGALQRGPAAHPSQYSFVDLYRLTVAGPAGTLFPVPATDTPVRVATALPAAQFSVAEVREPHLGMLLLSGIALAAWVARRRLGYGM